ncbi:DNA-directed RNA polymerase sigma-70 factor [Catellatospora sp. IY07-71]|uniref:SigE family RNA polymerase sigma factor n=1 Tax=Catellatospora sp. IY07-71 TaxID=2728827 RepID=UPI001BB6DBE9|nr:SigE family RNA polymerase sigma factor [Catellatospora sp. IY07-71]BCJ74988.1 DNA-directed RNA polymerase sigma-70 factor [Catellatospora sp. IY07-71]
MRHHDFDELYAAHFTSVTTQLFAYLGDRQEAQDVTQEAFCRALARWKDVSAYDDPVAWVRRVAWNLATSHFRRARAAAAFRRRHQEVYAPEPSPDRVALFAALRTLPPRPRQAVVLHYLADQAVVDIAESMKVSTGTVKSWLHRARTALGEQLQPAVNPGAEEVRNA